jgi:hypothetical protein
MTNDQPNTTDFVCSREGIVSWKDGSGVGLIERLPLHGGWYWLTSNMEHAGVSRTKKAALSALVDAWESEHA